MPAPLPAAVASQAKASEDMANALRQGQHPQASTPVSPDTVVQTTTPAPAEIPAPAQPAQPVTNPQQNLTWEQRFNTLQGKYNAEIPRLNKALDDLTQKLNTTNQRCLDLESENRQLREAATQPATPEGEGKITINPDDFESYGPEFVQMATLLQSVAKTNQDTVKKVEDFSTQSATEAADARTKFEDALTDRVGDWRALNFDPGFIAWLQVLPQGAAKTRLQDLRDKEAALDHAGCAELFNAYKSEHPFQMPGAQPTPNPNTPAPNINSQFTPDSSGGAGETAPNVSQRTWTRAQIKQFFLDKANGKYNGTLGTPEDAAALERDIHAAPGEGRVIG